MLEPVPHELNVLQDVLLFSVVAHSFAGLREDSIETIFQCRIKVVPSNDIIFILRVFEILFSLAELGRTQALKAVALLLFSSSYCFRQ